MIFHLYLRLSDLSDDEDDFGDELSDPLAAEELLPPETEPVELPDDELPDELLLLAFEPELLLPLFLLTLLTLEGELLPL